MFKDYYKILEVSPSTDDATIKRAYREMSMRWHPDKNPDIDVTAVMQDINEAYAILKDIAKRSRYDQEYIRFCGAFEKEEAPQNTVNTNEKEHSQYCWTYEYDVHQEESIDTVMHHTLLNGQLLVVTHHAHKRMQCFKSVIVVELLCRIKMYLVHLLSCLLSNVHFFRVIAGICFSERDTSFREFFSCE